MAPLRSNGVSPLNYFSNILKTKEDFLNPYWKKCLKNQKPFLIQGAADDP